MESSYHKEALLFVADLNILHVFVRAAVDLTFECSSSTQRQTGLMHAEQFFKWLQEVLEVAAYITTDVFQTWLCLAELICSVQSRTSCWLTSSLRCPAASHRRSSQWWCREMLDCTEVKLERLSAQKERRLTPTMLGRVRLPPLMTYHKQNISIIRKL